MDKLVIAFLAAALATASGSVFQLPTGRPPLQQKLERIISLIPIAKVSGVVRGYVDSGDLEVREAVEFARSGRLRHLVERISGEPAVQAQLHELETKGIRVNQTLLFVADLVRRQGSEEVVAVKPLSKGLAGLYAQVLSVVPIEKILGEVVVLLLTDAEVQIIYEALRRRECWLAARDVLRWGEVRAELARLRTAHVDVDAILAALQRLLGWPDLLDRDAK